MAWMLSKTGERVLACDLDPQADLTTAFLGEARLEALWGRDAKDRTVYQCVAPLTVAGDFREPLVQRITDTLGLVPGDPALSGIEESLSDGWLYASRHTGPYRPFHLLAALSQVMRSGASAIDATVVPVDVGPDLGALNRAALIAADHILTPLGADMLSLQSLENLGPALKRRADEWSRRRESGGTPDSPLPGGVMEPVGYTVQRHGALSRRPVRACDRWINRMTEAYHRHSLGRERGPYPDSPGNDRYRLAIMKHYRSPVSMAREARKPVFALTSADGAIGGHAAAVSDAYDDFRALANHIRQKTGLSA